MFPEIPDLDLVLNLGAAAAGQSLGVGCNSYKDALNGGVPRVLPWDRLQGRCVGRGRVRAGTGWGPTPF